jgi:WD40 repeat protein
MEGDEVQILKGHLSTKPVRSLAFSPDGTKLASSARDYKTFLWDLATGGHEVIEPWASHRVAYSPDGNTVAIGQGSAVVLWDVPSRTKRDVPSDRCRLYPAALAFSPDGTRLAAVGTSIAVWDFPSLDLLVAPVYAGAEWEGSSLVFSRDGSTLATAHGKFVRLRHATTWQVWQDLTGPTARIEAIAFSPDGRHLAACAGRTLWVWVVASRDVIVRHVIGKQHFQDVAFSPDGRLLAFARNDASIRFWDTGIWSEVAAYDWEVGPMICLAFAPDGMRAAGGSGKGKIVVFDVDL